MSKNVVFAVAVKVPEYPWRGEPYNYGIASWKRWCAKNDCQLFILDQQLHPTSYMKINWNRYYAFKLLEDNGIEYDQILVTDIDSIIHPDTPNFFEMSENKFCVTHADGSYDWLIRSIENYSKYAFDGKTFPVHKYANAGFQIVNKKHKQFYEDLLNFYHNNKDILIEVDDKLGVGKDQPVLNFLLHESDIDVKYFPYQYCMVDLPRKELLDEEMTYTKCGWIYQFNALPDNANANKTLYWMKKTYEHFYGELND
tara:strand:+ start:602 stop:1366 length:765 start_codon:yes stop_codon:yes gene_type:complete